MDRAELVERIFDHVENDHVDKAVRASLRLARKMGDHMSTALFLQELVEDRKEVIRVIIDDTSHLKEEAQKFLVNHSFDRWLVSRTLPFSVGRSGDNEPMNIMTVSVGEFPAELEQCERSISDLTLPSTMGEYDSAVFTERHSAMKSQFRLRIKAINVIKSRVLNRCLNFAIHIERQIAAQQKTNSFLERTQNEVQNYFRARSEDVYDKLQKANQLVESDSREDLSLLLTQVRRAMKAIADHFYPPVEGAIRCVDGIERKLGDDQYLNRLHEFVYSQFQRSTATDLLRAELDHLLVFAKKLNDIASKGVHAEVTLQEAQQGFVGLYMFLFNIIRRLDARQD